MPVTAADRAVVAARRWAIGVTLIVVSGLGACVSSQDERAPVVAASAAAVPALPPDRLVGKWGIASYRDEKDRKRVEAQARAQCRLPYTIAKGPTDGVMIHFADDPKLYELKLKSSRDGRTYLGFEAPPGDWQDREVLELTDTTLVMRFVDPEIDGRYGTLVYARCPR